MRSMIAAFVLLSLAPAFGQEQPDFSLRSLAELRYLDGLFHRMDVLAELNVTFAQRRNMLADEADDVLEAELSRKEETLTKKEIEEFRRRILIARLTAAARFLSPAEMKRIEQIALQLRVLDAGIGETLEKTIDLSDEQKAKIREKEEKLADELRALMWALTRQAQDELSKSMTPAQQRAWKKRVGENFEFQSSSPGLRPLRALR